MGSENIQYGQAKVNLITVYYTGTDQLDEGYALCYDADRGTAASIDDLRTFNVEKPSVTNVRWFAGVVARKPATVGPCYVTVIPPGNAANVYAYVSATVDSTRMTVMAGQYYLKRSGFAGRGSAIALQTLDRSVTAGLVQAYLEDGEESGGVEEIQPPTTGATGTVMNTGVSYFIGTVTIGGGDHVLTLADGTKFGQRKGLICLGTFTTNDIEVSVTHHQTSDPETFEYDEVTDQTILTWLADAWYTTDNSATIT